nr:hypothetical protein [Tanacetum cinerariifolium]
MAFLRPASSFKDISRDAIHRDFFPFSLGPYYAIYPEGGVAGNLKQSSVTPASKSLELPSNIIHASSTTALEPNEECVNAMVDRPGHEMTDGIVNAKPSSAFVQGASYAIDDATELTLIGLEHVSSCPSDVVVALSAR